MDLAWVKKEKNWEQGMLLKSKEKIFKTKAVVKCFGKFEEGDI